MIKTAHSLLIERFSGFFDAFYEEVCKTPLADQDVFCTLYAFVIGCLVNLDLICERRLDFVLPITHKAYETAWNKMASKLKWVTFIKEFEV